MDFKKHPQGAGIPSPADIVLEDAITACRRCAECWLKLGARKEASGSYAAMADLISRRSWSQVARMEREQGLVRR